MTLFKVNQFSPFVADKLLRECAARAGLPRHRRGRWVFILITETAIRTKARDPLLPFLYALRIERTELIGLIVEELDKRVKAVGLLCNDGLFVHPISFGKVMLKIGRESG